MAEIKPRRMPNTGVSLPPEMRDAIKAWGEAQPVPAKVGPAMRELLRRALAAEGVKVGESKATGKKARA